MVATLHWLSVGKIKSKPGERAASGPTGVIGDSGELNEFSEEMPNDERARDRCRSVAEEIHVTR